MRDDDKKPKKHDSNRNLVAIMNGVVVNTIAITRFDKHASRQFLESRGYVVVENADADIGDTYAKDKFKKPKADK